MYFLQLDAFCLINNQKQHWDLCIHTRGASRWSCLTEYQRIKGSYSTKTHSSKISTIRCYKNSPKNSPSHEIHILLSDDARGRFFLKSVIKPIRLIQIHRCGGGSKRWRAHLSRAWRSCIPLHAGTVQETEFTRVARETISFRWLLFTAMAIPSRDLVAAGYSPYASCSESSFNE